MTKATLYNQEGKAIKDIELPARIFGVEFNNDLVHQVVVAQNANARSPWAHTKIRDEVRGGGKKPWRQKGTGRARHGSIRSPIWRGGGTTFGPRNERDYSQKINKKMKRKALFMVLSRKNNDSGIAFVDAITLREAETKQADIFARNFISSVFKFLIAKNKKITGKKVLVVEATKNTPLEKSFANMLWAKVTTANSLNVGDILTYKYVVIAEPAIEKISKTFLKENV